jgi:hypothetical protein
MQISEGETYYSMLSIVKHETCPIVLKIKRLFTMGYAWEVEESLTTLGTIVAWEFLNCCRHSH